MLKLGPGDLIMMALGMLAILLMILIGPGKRDVNDPQAELRTNNAYIRAFTQIMSPVLVVALIIGLAAVAYVFIAAYLKAL